VGNSISITSNGIGAHSNVGHPDVCCGSVADMTARIFEAQFTPNSDIRQYSWHSYAGPLSRFNRPEAALAPDFKTRH
jgi:hypothetical protein